ncbi:MAG: Hsp20/alpha crystallin family protein [Desulfopila sp.]|nr:Hsp20/alpha crystallin family protein [Desulfopila sp.]
MDLKKLAPWNWFKKEDEEASTSPIPVDRKNIGSTVESYPQPLHHFQQQMEQLFDRFFRDFSSRGYYSGETANMVQSGFLRPFVNVGGNEQHYSITVEIPGVDEKDIKVELSDGTLTISGEKRQEKEDKGNDFYRMERSYGSFRRVLTLPQDADQDHIEANFRRGVLSLVIPKKALPDADIRKIQISSSE